tara:strand:+ start:1890 stop:2864 length:975 start_codon:yes stop_codon:yes gene_type:complete
MFFTNPDIIDNFFKKSHNGQKTVEKAYKRAELIEIAENLGVSDLKGTKAILVERIFKRIGPGTEASLRNDIRNDLVINKQEGHDGDKPTKTYTKPYDDCSLEELKEEATAEGILTTGSRNDIVDRLKALDAGTGNWVDTTTDFLRKKLEKNGYISTGDRATLLTRIQECDDRFIGPAENKTTAWLKKYLESNQRLSTVNRQDCIERVKRMYNVLYPVLADFNDEYLKYQLVSRGVSINGTRKDWLLRIYPFEISELFKTCKNMKHNLSKKPRVEYRTKYRNNNRKKTSMLGHMANGVALGAGLSLGARIFGRRIHVEEKSNLKF